MKPVQIFPSILILLDICASVVYGLNGNTRMVGYWLSAAAITAFVTF